MATGELGIEQGIGLGVKPREEVNVGNRIEEVKVRVAERWAGEGNAALKRWEELIQEGVGGMVQEAVKGRVRPEVEEVMGSVRWLGANAPERLMMWMRGLGLDEKEMLVAQSVAEAIGDRDKLPNAVWNLKRAMEEDLKLVEGGEALVKIMEGVRLLEQSTTGQEEEWLGSGKGVSGGGGVSMPPGGAGKKDKDEWKDKDKRGKGGLFSWLSGFSDARSRAEWGARTRRGFLILLSVGAVAICARLGLIQFAARGLGVGEDKAEEAAVDERFIPVMGDKLASEALVRHMFEGRVEDPEHRAIEKFLRTYGTATPDVKAARGESMLEELARRGLLQTEGGVTSVDEKGLISRLESEGYAPEEVDELIEWTRQYLQDRDRLLGELQGGFNQEQQRAAIKAQMISGQMKQREMWRKGMRRGGDTGLYHRGQRRT